MKGKISVTFLAIAVFILVAFGLPGGEATTAAVKKTYYKADQCCFGCQYASQCCCGRHPLKEVTQTLKLIKTFKKTQTVFVTTTVKAGHRIAARAAPVSAEPLAEINNVPETKLANEEVLIEPHDLFARHLCPVCPSGITLQKGKPKNNDGSQTVYCCPGAKTRTLTVRKSKTVTVTVKKTKTQTASAQWKVAGRVYYDINNNLIYDAGDVPIANEPLVLLSSVKKSAARVAGSLATTTSDSQGLFEFVLVAQPPVSSTLGVAKQCDPGTVIKTIETDASGIVNDTVNGFVPFNATTTATRSQTHTKNAGASTTAAAVQTRLSTTAPVFATQSKTMTVGGGTTGNVQTTAGAQTTAAGGATTSNAAAPSTTLAGPPTSSLTPTTSVPPTTTMSATTSITATYTTSTCANTTGIFPFVGFGNGNGNTGYNQLSALHVSSDGTTYGGGWYMSYYVKPFVMGSIELPQYPYGQRYTAQPLLFKLDSKGTTVWAISNNNATVSNYADCMFNAVTEGPDGSIWAGGNCKASPIAFGSFSVTKAAVQDLMIVKVDKTTGTVLNMITSSGGDASVEAMTVSSAGEVFVLGTIDGGSITLGSVSASAGFGGKDIFLAKLNSTGGTQWIKTYGASAADTVISHKIAFQDSTHILIITQHASSAPITMPNGDVYSTAIGDVSVLSLVATSDGTFVKTQTLAQATASWVTGFDLSATYIYYVGYYADNVITIGSPTSNQSYTIPGGFGNGNDLFFGKIDRTNWDLAGSGLAHGWSSDTMNAGIVVADQANEKLVTCGTTKSIYHWFNDPTGTYSQSGTADPNGVFWNGYQNIVLLAIDGSVSTMNVTNFHMVIPDPTGAEGLSSTIDTNDICFALATHDGKVYAGGIISTSVLQGNCGQNYVFSAGDSNPNNADDIWIGQFNPDLSIPNPVP